MGRITADGHTYYRKLPHFRDAGAIYHARMSIHPDFGLLKESRDFQIIQDAIMFWHKIKCMLIAYVIMPNHSHLLLQPLPFVEGWQAWSDYQLFYKLEDILASIKKFSGREINRLHGRTGCPIWKDENFDRTVRINEDLDGVVEYIHANPIRWKLCLRPEDYPWSSASTIYSGRSEYRDWFVTRDSTGKKQFHEF
jgi:REP element-mobilizing transposase RayT